MDDVLKPTLDNRALTMLTRVAEGRGELICSCEPDLIIDGLRCCDQFTAHKLASAGLIRPVEWGPVGTRVRAELSLAGIAVVRTYARGSLSG